MSHLAILFIAALLFLPVILLAAEAPANLLKNADFSAKEPATCPPIGQPGVLSWTKRPAQRDKRKAVCAWKAERSRSVSAALSRP